MFGLSTSRLLWLGAFAWLALGSSFTALANPVEPCRPTVVCAVEVTDLPAVLRGGGGYELVAGPTRTTLPSSGTAYLAISEPTKVRLEGAAFHGSVMVDPAECGGDAVHTITAILKPAQLVFQAGAVPLSNLVISCVEGCAYKQRPADDFPELPFPRDANELRVELEFKARGHRPQTAEFQLSPGLNSIRVTLDRVE